jgi:hypothetical protein
VVAGRKDISKDNRWPAGKIEAVPFKFPVLWRIESPQSPDGFVIHKQEEMTPLITARAAWDLLRHDIPQLFETATLDFSGFLKPGLNK